MDFTEVDEARRAVAEAPPKKGRRRKGDKDQDPDHAFGNPSDRRTGRWSTEEVAYCDILIAKFGTGELPVEEKTKLNEFLGNMLKSKQMAMNDSTIANRLLYKSSNNMLKTFDEKI